jgi:hypothetical protein
MTSTYPYIIRELASILAFAALGLPPHASPRTQDGAIPEALAYQKTELLIHGKFAAIFRTRSGILSLSTATVADFREVTKIPTDGQPGIFATLDAGALRTLGLCFMYDVKQV